MGAGMAISNPTAEAQPDLWRFYAPYWRETINHTQSVDRRETNNLTQQGDQNQFFHTVLTECARDKFALEIFLTSSNLSFQCRIIHQITNSSELFVLRSYLKTAPHITHIMSFTTVLLFIRAWLPRGCILQLADATYDTCTLYVACRTIYTRSSFNIRFFIIKVVGELWRHLFTDTDQSTFQSFHVLCSIQCYFGLYTVQVIDEPQSRLEN